MASRIAVLGTNLSAVLFLQACINGGTSVDCYPLRKFKSPYCDIPITAEEKSAITAIVGAHNVEFRSDDTPNVLATRMYEKLKKNPLLQERASDQVPTTYMYIIATSSEHTRLLSNADYETVVNGKLRIHSYPRSARKQCANTCNGTFACTETSDKLLVGEYVSEFRSGKRRAMEEFLIDNGYKAASTLGTVDIPFQIGLCLDFSKKLTSACDLISVGPALMHWTDSRKSVSLLYDARSILNAVKLSDVSQYRDFVAKLRGGRERAAFMCQTMRTKLVATQQTTPPVASSADANSDDSDYDYEEEDDENPQEPKVVQRSSDRALPNKILPVARQLLMQRTQKQTGPLHHPGLF